MRTILHVVIMLFPFISAGCALFTGEDKGREIAEERIKFMQAGTTTKEDVLLRLGEPHRVLRGERYFLYFDFTKEGVPLGLGMGIPVSQHLYLLLIEFDDKDRVKIYEVKSKSLPGTITTKGTAYHHRRALLQQLSRWVNQVIGSSM
jgi:outer membrane protein assembly factor BamE (lipoprotein component of BamABCDE complex)